MHDYNVKMPNFTFCGECEHTRQRLCFSFPELQYSLLEFNSRKINIANIWRIEQDRISAMKFEAAWLHFLSDVFKAITNIVA